MENRKSFGAFLLQRRKELGLTQKEFAERLFVTDSAVSKWERGLAYPDITLLQSICEILQVSEKELLSASEDVEGRRAEQLAKKYIRLSRKNRLIQSLLYGGTLAVCLICNLSIQHTLSWFWLVLGGLMICASLTFLPSFAPEGRREATVFGGFLVSLLFTLAVSCLYSGGSWFLVAAVGSAFGLGLVFLPLVLRQLPLPPELRERKALLYVCVELALLILLYALCILPENWAWFISATLWTLFGLALFLLPVFLRRAIPLPEAWRSHKALVYFAVMSLLLLLGMVWEGRFGEDHLLPTLLITGIALILPWGWLGAVRYLPIPSRWTRLGSAFLWTAVWLEFFPWLLDRILLAAGEVSSRPVRLLPQGVDLSNWTDGWVISDNINFLIILGFLALGALCICLGVRRKKGE